jgi:hypothetical protein
LLGGFEIDRKLKLLRLLHGKIGGLAAVDNFYRGSWLIPKRVSRLAVEPWTNLKAHHCLKR